MSLEKKAHSNQVTADASRLGCLDGAVSERRNCAVVRHAVENELSNCEPARPFRQNLATAAADVEHRHRRVICLQIGRGDDPATHARLLPVAQAPPARHPRPAPEFLREHLPGNAAAKDEDNAGEARAIRDARPPTPWPSWRNRQERFDKIPQRIWKQRGGHTRPRYRAATGWCSCRERAGTVLLCALRAVFRLRSDRGREQGREGQMFVLSSFNCGFSKDPTVTPDQLGTLATVARQRATVRNVGRPDDPWKGPSGTMDYWRCGAQSRPLL